MLTNGFVLQCPKSLDRNAFAFTNIGLPDFSIAGGAATLLVLTAASVARIVPHLPTAARAWIVAGGGARNPTLMRMLAERLKAAKVEIADVVGWSSQSIEAQAFAYGGAHGQRPADHISSHNRRKAVDAGRNYRHAVRLTGCPI